MLAAPPFWPDLEGAILCLEEDEEESPATVDRSLFQLRQMGVFDRISGLILGRFPPEVGFASDDPLDSTIARATRGYEFPIAVDLDFGHTDPMFLLPYGVHARLDVSGEIPRFHLLEPVVVKA